VQAKRKCIAFSAEARSDDSIVTGSHEMFVGKIEYVHADEGYVNSEGKIDFSSITYL